MGHYGEALVNLLPTDKGGRSEVIRFSDKLAEYFHARFRVQDGRSFAVEFIYCNPGTMEKELQPGDSGTVGFAFCEDIDSARQALDLDSCFEILEGSRVIGSGRVVGHYGFGDVGDDIDGEE